MDTKRGDWCSSQKSTLDNRVEKYTGKKFTPQINWDWVGLKDSVLSALQHLRHYSGILQVGCSQDEFASLQAESAKKMTLKTTVKASFLKLKALELALEDLDEEVMLGKDMPDVPDEELAERFEIQPKLQKVPHLHMPIRCRVPFVSFTCIP
jgi:hypothetical protein